MKLLDEISIPEYQEGRDLCADVDSIAERTEDSDSTLYVARFLVPGSMAVEGLVSVEGVYDDDTVHFRLANKDGEVANIVNQAPITDKGIVGSLRLIDVRVLGVKEGYFHAYGNEIDDELMTLITEQQRNLVPVHVTMGGAVGDSAREQLHL